MFFSKSFGNVLVLDGIVQCSERDEFAYQEMIAHLPLNCHSNPKKVLVVGGGDGGVVREVLKHNVQSVVLCEIDEEVVEVSKKYLTEMSKSFGDPRLKVFIGDGVQFMKQNKGEFDVIITDAPDPIGVAKGLFETDYYNSMKTALAPGGIVCSQGESFYFDLEFITGFLAMARTAFPRVGFAYTMMPSYTGGHIGFVMCSTSPDVVFEEPVRCYTDEEISQMDLRYYNTAIHRAAFVLPQFVKKALEPAQGTNGQTVDT
ncbi:spermidine synthase-like [Argopecten irradians]|uniref:spermidine synthase-like n=1 Tax=Argopecten irradians TaxID=31199 RepID=UPI003716BDAF